MESGNILSAGRRRLFSALRPGSTNGDSTKPVIFSGSVVNGNGIRPSLTHSEESLGSKDRPLSGVTPPYWRHQRAISRASLISVDSTGTPAITLEDHTEDPDSDSSRGLWAKSVTIDDHVFVEGKTGVGAYVVWNCKVQTLEGGQMMIRMRYSQFDDLRKRLLAAFPHAKDALPALPPKSVFCMLYLGSLGGTASLMKWF